MNLKNKKEFKKIKKEKLSTAAAAAAFSSPLNGFFFTSLLLLPKHSIVQTQQTIEIDSALPPKLLQPSKHTRLNTKGKRNIVVSANKEQAQRTKEMIRFGSADDDDDSVLFLFLFAFKPSSLSSDSVPIRFV